MECIAIINQKGGVGKTATAVNLGAGLSNQGLRVLLIDMDPQGHLTTHFGFDRDAQDRSLYEVLAHGLSFESAIRRYSPTLSVVPAQINLAAVEAELVSVVGREVILRDILAGQAWPFDIAMLDCPPSLGILTLNALCAADRVLIPMQPHFLALQGVGKLFDTISLVSQRLNPRLVVEGLIMCMYESGTRLSGEVIEDLSAFLESSQARDVPWKNARLFKTRIRRNIKLAESPSYGQSIFDYAPRSNGAMDYLALSEELMALLNGSAEKEPPRASGEASVAADDQTPTPASVSVDRVSIALPESPNQPDDHSPYLPPPTLPAESTEKTPSSAP